MKSRVMRAALSLHDFTVADLQALSGVKSVTVQGVIDRHPHFFSSLESLATGKRGRKAKRYRFVEKYRKDVEADFNLAFGAGPMSPRLIEAPSVDENFQVAFVAAQSTVRALSSVEPPSNADSLKGILSTLMRAARSSLVLAKDSPNHQAFESNYAALQAEVDRLVYDRNPVIAPRPRNWVSTHAAMDWLKNWLGEKSRILDCARKALEVEPACDRFDRLMHNGGLKDDRGPEELLLPAVGLAARLGQGASPDDIGHRIAQRLAEEDVMRSPRMFASLVSCAAVCGAQEALTPMLTAVTRPGFHRTLSGTERETVLHSIARFGRPGPDEAPESAALISYVMLNLSETRERDFSALLPATVRSDSMSRQRLLEEAASVLYCASDGTRSLDRLEEGRLMRNIAAAMSADEMEALAGVLPELVLNPAGERFVASLTCREHGAIRLRDTDEQGLVLSPGRALIGSSILKKTFQTRIAVGIGSEPAEKLIQLIERQSPTVRASEELTYEVEDNDKNADGVDFIYQLSKSRAALLLRAA
jgi:hypothetical protein